MESRKAALLDLDHVVTGDGQIYRVVGNLESETHYLGYNVYSPSVDGDRLYRCRRYKKNFKEDDNQPVDVLETYGLISVDDVTDHHEPIQSAESNCGTFESTVWFELYMELVRVFGSESVGIFGSSMFGLHLTADGRIRKDIDFVIQGLSNVEMLRQHLPRIREQLGFTTVTAERQLQQYDRYRKVFRNENNSIRPIIARRWTGLQLSERVVTTIRLRDLSLRMPIELVAPSMDSHDVVVSGRVADADGSNLFPRMFRVITPHEQVSACILWWKFSTPVRDGDAVTLCGNLVMINGQPTVRLTNFSQRWLRIDD